MSSEIKHLYGFGTFRLDPAERQLMRDGALVPLSPKAFDTLIVLVERSGHLVDKDELMRLVWAEAFVEEANLARCIYTLRKALGEQHDEQQYIETVPKRGYRFVAEVQVITTTDSKVAVPERIEAESRGQSHLAAESSNGAGADYLKPEVRRNETGAIVSFPPPSPSVAPASLPAAPHRRVGAFVSIVLLVVAAAVGAYFYFYRSRPVATDKAAIKSIAVLPFVNVGTDPETEFLSDGISESLINSLSQLSKLRVIARTTAFRYKGSEADAKALGRDLSVDAIITGRVTQQGDTLVVQADLLSTADGSQVWGQRYSRKLSDIFTVQQQIAAEIAGNLRPKLTDAEQQQLAKRPTDNLKAFQYYLQGQVFAQRRTREGLLTAIRYCERALDEDRNYALAYAGLADAYGILGMRGYIAPVEGQGKAEEAAREALAIDENLAEAHATLGQAYVMFSPPNFLLGERELRRAIELNPGLAMAHQYLGMLLMRVGRLDESMGELLKARELDPLSPIITRHVALHYYLKQDHQRALELLRQADELGPPFATSLEIEVYTQNGLFHEALAKLEQAKLERKDDPVLIYSTGIVYAAQGRRAEALQMIKRLEEISGPNLSQALLIAKIYVALNEKELGLTWLERSLRGGPIGAFYIIDPTWGSINGDPRFANVLHRMGLEKS